MSDFDAVYTVKREVSQDQFMRKLLIELASNYNTPNDVCTASFGEVQECEKAVIACSAHVETDYSASVGYDRKEQYQSTESTYVSEGSWYTCNGVQKRADHSGMYKVDCIKERTVTDWQPYSGHSSGDSVCLVFNEATSNDPFDENDRIVPVIKSVQSNNIVEKGEAALSSVALERAKKGCAAVVEGEITFPGDHVKDKRINSTTTVQGISCYKMPFYEVSFNYADKKYSASGFACGKPNAESQLPPNNVDIQGTVNQETKPWKIGMIAGWALAAVTFIISCILSGSQAWFWAIFAVVTVAAIVVTVVGNSKYNKLKKALESDNKSKKLADLQTALAHYGYKELSAEEMANF